MTAGSCEEQQTDKDVRDGEWPRGTNATILGTVLREEATCPGRELDQPPARKRNRNHQVNPVVNSINYRSTTVDFYPAQYVLDHVVQQKKQPLRSPSVGDSVTGIAVASAGAGVEGVTGMTGAGVGGATGMTGAGVGSAVGGTTGEVVAASTGAGVEGAAGGSVGAGAVPSGRAGRENPRKSTK